MDSSRRTARLAYRDGRIEVFSPYDAGLVSALKAGLRSRRWNPDRKVWSVDASERQRLIDIVSEFFQVTGDDSPGPKDDNAADSDPEPREAPSGASMESVIESGAEVAVWTDGACIRNPGPGGYGILLKCQGQEWEKADGFRLTTNNRMEIMAVLAALESLPEKCKVDIYTDSQYVVNSVSKGWVRKWKAAGWVKQGNEKVPNSDLWQRMLELIARHEVEFHWIKGHNDTLENERCDRMAEHAARKPDLPPDAGYRP